MHPNVLNLTDCLMPGDSTIFPNTDSIIAVLKDSLIQATTKTQASSTDARKDNFTVYMIILASLFLIYLIYFFTKKSSQKTGLKIHHSNHSSLMVNPDIALPFEFPAILDNHFPFYQQLIYDEKIRFLSRLEKFVEIKQFVYYGFNGNKEIPILVSAAAIQLTFGLKKFTLDYFKKIHIYKEGYTTSESPHRLAGHVGDSGLHISWKHFEEGYRFPHDKQNVGLHELAHALEYNNFVAGVNIDRRFAKGFGKFSYVGGPFFFRTRLKGNKFFSEYAFTNYQEFWAECVECFFEVPEEFGQQQPDLFHALCLLLNQGPSKNITNLSGLDFS